jgi:glutathionyl-hydroquinone reductase
MSSAKQDGPLADKDGHFRRKASQFRNWISADPNAEFPAEKDRYVLYLNFGCPWAHRTNIVRSLKGLEDILELVVMGVRLTEEGWCVFFFVCSIYWKIGWWLWCWLCGPANRIFDGENGSMPKDPLYGFTKVGATFLLIVCSKSCYFVFLEIFKSWYLFIQFRDLYFKADPNYQGRFTVPVIWDKKKETIVNNESSEIIRMLYSSFDALIPEHLRETAKPLLPDQYKAEIDEMNEWVYDTVNNGVYKIGFASTQEAYEANIYPLFKSLDRLEKRLADRGTKFLFGDHITEADIRLYTTIARFDHAYFTIFKCNLKMIRYDYPNLHLWLRRLYWDKGPETNGGAFGKTTYWDPIKQGYAGAAKWNVIPVGPDPPVLPLTA